MSNPGFFVVDAMVGLLRLPAGAQRPTVADWHAEMQRLHITRAVVRHRFCIDIGPWYGNDLLMEELAGDPALVPAWALTPDGRPPDFDIAAAVRAMLARGVKAAWLEPKSHMFSAMPWCAEDLYAALQTARVPLLLRYAQVTPDEIDAVCSAFPDLRLVLLRIPRIGRNRMLYPLLQRHPQLRCCFDPGFSVFGGFADLCRRFGEHRWVLGTTYPDAEGGAGITGLMYAGLPDSAVAAIARGNLEQLLAEVRTDVL